MGKLQVRLMFIMLSMDFILMMGSVSAFTHVVGGSYGWRVPQNLTYYEDWAKPRTFGVGDILGKFIHSYPAMYYHTCFSFSYHVFFGA